MRRSPLQIIDGTLFLYGAVVTFFLIASAFLDLDSPGSALLLVLFFPVAVYFLIKTVSSVSRLLQNILNLDQQKQPYFGNFSLATFIDQSETSFLINIVLLCFAVALILFRISLQIIK